MECDINQILDSFNTIIGNNYILYTNCGINKFSDMSSSNEFSLEQYYYLDLYIKEIVVICVFDLPYLIFPFLKINLNLCIDCPDKIPDKFLKTNNYQLFFYKN